VLIKIARFPDCKLRYGRRIKILKSTIMQARIWSLWRSSIGHGF